MLVYIYLTFPFVSQVVIFSLTHSGRMLHRDRKVLKILIKANGPHNCKFGINVIWDILFYQKLYLCIWTFVKWLYRGLSKNWILDSPTRQTHNSDLGLFRCLDGRTVVISSYFPGDACTIRCSVDITIKVLMRTKSTIYPITAYKINT